ncbi:hypothetical protein [Pseudotenacibaculum haliotis]|uniref:Uncharacterized protein n=1 Tax=Pseudotenacibaculum haliotis TaxID=1862138 RepID=A0ABW5LWW8_9FLAO
MSLLLSNSDSQSITLDKLENTANKTFSPGPGQNTPAQIDIGADACSLTVKLTNNMNENLTWKKDYSIRITLPDFLPQPGNTQITITPEENSGWEDTSDSNDYQISPKADGLVWNAGDSLSFTINKVKSSKTQSAVGKEAQISFHTEFAYLIPTLSPSLNLIKPSTPGNKKLSDHLTVELQQNEIFVTDLNNPLPSANTLYLNITNKKQEPVSTVDNSDATVSVYFVYGCSPGALTPGTANQCAKPGGTNNPYTASQIAGSISQNLSSPYVWSGPAASSPGKGNSNGGTSDNPQWVFQPLKPSGPGPYNGTVLGTGANSTVTFKFDNIEVFYPGTTIMYVYFDGFKKASGEPYDSEFFVLTINKKRITPTIHNFSVTTANTNHPNVISYQDGALDANATFEWEVSWPPGFHKDDVSYSILIKSTSFPNTSKTISNTLLQTATITKVTETQYKYSIPINLTHKCSWDLTNETELTFDFSASITDSNQMIAAEIKKDETP